MTRTLLIPAVLALSLAGCADMNDSTRRGLTGAGAGALAGGAIGSLSGNFGWGAAIGAAAGAAGGLLYDHHVQSQEQAYQRGVQSGRRQATTGSGATSTAPRSTR